MRMFTTLSTTSEHHVVLLDSSSNDLEGHHIQLTTVFTDHHPHPHFFQRLSTHGSQLLLELCRSVHSCALAVDIHPLIEDPHFPFSVLPQLRFKYPHGEREAISSAN
jgi:hypothetical protein